MAVECPDHILRRAIQEAMYAADCESLSMSDDEADRAVEALKARLMRNSYWVVLREFGDH
jgi:hypothetical protein